MPRVEFTIEPFVEGRPGLHVTAAIDALRRLGLDVEVGPFGSSCEVARDRVALAVGELTRAAVENGADHLNIDISAPDGAESTSEGADATSAPRDVGAGGEAAR